MKYVDDIELTFEIIVSKAKGYRTKKLNEQLLLICQNLSNKFYYKDDDDRYDSIMDSYCYLLTRYNNFDEYKYDNAFPYITEIVKRRIAWYFNETILPNGIKVNQKEKESFKINYVRKDEIWKIL